MDGRDTTDTGMELRDLLLDSEFISNRRNLERHRRPLGALKRVAQAFGDTPDAVLQELVNIAVEYCGADSAGISLEEPDEKGSPTFRWVAIAGSFTQYLNGRTPRFFSPCGTCLSTGRSQLYRVTKPYYDFLGVVAEPILDGLLIPWITDDHRGTIWAVAHGSRNTFDFEDYELLKSLADFVALAIHQQALADQKRLLDRIEISAQRADQMAHLINNPLQGLTNTLYLARQGGDESKQQLDSAYEQLMALSETVRRQLSRRYTPGGEDE